MSNGTVIVKLSDLAKLADLICLLDNRASAPSVEDIGECHDVIMRMMGDHVGKHYAPDDGSEGVERLVA